MGSIREGFGFPPNTAPGGDGFGGAISSSAGTVRLINSTLSGNIAVGGTAAEGGTAGLGNGGALFSEGDVTIRFCTIARNTADLGSVVSRGTLALANSIVAYAVVSHRLMDISVIIRKTLIYSVVTSALTVIYMGIVMLFTNVFEGFAGYQTIFSSAIAAGLITICFQPLRKRVQAFVDRKFFRQYVDREEKLYELSREVITHTTTDAMGTALTRVLDETLHPKMCALYLRSASGSHFELSSGSNIASLPPMLEDDNDLSLYFKDHPQPFLLDIDSADGRSYSTRLKDDREDVA
jgi:hypothetical protein